MLSFHKANQMQRACNIFVNLPFDTYMEKIKNRKSENKKNCTLFEFTLNNISDHNVINYVIGMLEEFFNKKDCIECKRVTRNKIVIVLKF